MLDFVYTFWGSRLTPGDAALQVSMIHVSSRITRQTTMWRCWLGFNASHIVGLGLIVLIFGYLSAAHGSLLFESVFLLAVGLAAQTG